jgi:hypothetical protein
MVKKKAEGLKNRGSREERTGVGVGQKQFRQGAEKSVEGWLRNTLASPPSFAKASEGKEAS